MSFDGPISIGKPGRPLCDVLHSSVLISSCSDVSGRLCSNNALYAGCLLPVGKHVEFNSYYENENNIGGHNDHPENAVGLALYLLLSRIAGDLGIPQRSGLSFLTVAVHATGITVLIRGLIKHHPRRRVPGSLSPTVESQPSRMVFK